MACKHVCNFVNDFDRLTLLLYVSIIAWRFRDQQSRRLPDGATGVLKPDPEKLYLHDFNIPSV